MKLRLSLILPLTALLILLPVLLWTILSPGVSQTPRLTSKAKVADIFGNAGRCVRMAMGQNDFPETAKVSVSIVKSFP